MALPFVIAGLRDKSVWLNKVCTRLFICGEKFVELDF